MWIGVYFVKFRTLDLHVHLYIKDNNLHFKINWMSQIHTGPTLREAFNHLLNDRRKCFRF